MGRYEGSAPCPGCGDLHWMRGNDSLTGAFHLAADVLVQPTIDHYWRVRDPIDTTRATVMVSEARSRAFRACLCGARLAVVVDVEARVAEQRATIALLGWRFLDVRSSEFPDHIDYAWDHLDGGALSALPVAARLAALRERMRKTAREIDFPVDELMRVAGPTRCETCGDVRERSHATHLWSGVGFFGADVTARALYLGSTIEIEDRWLGEDVHRGQFHRLRHPLGDEVAILHRSRNWGCGCGAGRASFVTRFARRTGVLELVDLTIRAVSTREDLDGLDFIYLPPEALDVSRAGLFDEYARLEALVF